MKILWQIGLLFGICLVGEAVALVLPFAFPASVISMILLLILLLTKRVKPHQIKEESDFLLQNMSIMFLPAGVGVMEVFQEIKSSVLPLFFICIITTVLTFGVTSLTVAGVIKLQDKWLARRSSKEKKE